MGAHCQTYLGGSSQESKISPVSTSVVDRLLLKHDVHLFSAYPISLVLYYFEC